MSEPSGTSRVEAFSDGVFAIALTLLIIDVGIPSTAVINSTADLWSAIGHTAPSIFTFLLSFVVILITWVNHHSGMRLLSRVTPQFIYANGFLLLSIVFLPFPTALLGQYLFTDHAAPAVVLYSAVCAIQGVGWALTSLTALSPHDLSKNEKARRAILKTRGYAYCAIAIYSVCAIAAIWIPHIIAIVISLIWILWIVVGVTLND